MDIEARLLEMYRDPSLAEKPDLLDHRGGAFYSEAAAQLIASLHDGAGDVQVVDVRNDGAIPDLPDAAVVEIPAVIDRDGAHPLALAPLAPEQRGAGPGREGVRGAHHRGREDRGPGGGRQGARRESAGRRGDRVAAARRDPGGRRAAPGPLHKGLIRRDPAPNRASRKTPSRTTDPGRPPLRVSCAMLSRRETTPSRPSGDLFVLVLSIAGLPEPPVPTERPAPVHRRLDRRHRLRLPRRDRPHRRDRGRQRLRRARQWPPVGVDAREPTSCPEEIVVLDRTGKIELARFGEFKREVVTFDEIPPVLLDATTAIEDKTFWENAGFDPMAIIAAGIDSIRGNSRGASTITQQLVRARLLDPDLVQDPERTVERKLKEIIQSIRLTKAYPGEDGKKRIITAYLNQNYYGNQSYGVKAAAESLLRQGARRSDTGRSGDARRAAAVAVELRPRPQRRRRLRRRARRRRRVPRPEDERAPHPRARHQDRPATGHRPRPDGRRPDPAVGQPVLAADLEAEKGKELVLARRPTPQWKAPHFVWAVQRRADQRSCAARMRRHASAAAGRPAGDDHARLRPAEDRREVGQGRGDRRHTRATRRSIAQGPRVR